jgi:hypothetical protein
VPEDPLEVVRDLVEACRAQQDLGWPRAARTSATESAAELPSPTATGRLGRPRSQPGPGAIANAAAALDGRVDAAILAGKLALLDRARHHANAD